MAGKLAGPWRHPATVSHVKVFCFGMANGPWRRWVRAKWKLDATQVGHEGSSGVYMAGNMRESA